MPEDTRLFEEVFRKRGVVRQEGRINNAELDQETGFVKSVTLESGNTIEADLFRLFWISGPLIEQTLKTGYDEWTHWLPCNRAVALPCNRDDGSPRLLTKATAHAAGWQWQVPTTS